jgi:hypothetical protein
MSASQPDLASSAPFATARTLEPTDAEVARVLARLPALAPPRPGRRRLVALALASALIVVGAASAATGLLPVGTELPAPGHVPGAGEPRYTSNQVVVGTGELASAGHWQMTMTRSDQGQCLGLGLVNMRETSQQLVCGVASFDAISLGGGSDLPETTVVFGPAPERASAVRVSAPDGFRLRAPTHEGHGAMDGDFYVVEIPRQGVVNAQITWLDERGRAAHAGTYIPSTIRYGPAQMGPQPPH